MSTDEFTFDWAKSGNDAEVHVMTVTGCNSSSAIAAFDLDGTLIVTKSGRVFATHAGDWKLQYDPQIKQTLRKLYDDGFKIVIITNQAGISKGLVKIEDFKKKTESIVREIGVPLQLFCSTSSKSFYRKPRVGTWEYLEKYWNNDIPIDMQKSFYCGDAAGRERPGGKKDFSCSDRLFAINVGVDFRLPEEVFLKKKCGEAFKLPDFDPRTYQPASLLEPSSKPLTLPAQEVVLMVGVQGSGKSHFAETHLGKAGYSVISNDKTGGRDKSLSTMKKALTIGKSVVVDNTHVNPEARQKFIEMAGRFAVSCRAFVMNTTPGQARHNLVFRELTDKEHSHIGEPLIRQYFNKYKEPTVAEGFSDIVKVNVIPKFKYKQHHTLYHMFLVEK